MDIDQFARPFTKALSSNANTSSFASKIATITEPSGDGVITLATSSGCVPIAAKLVPYGLGSSNDAFDMKVIGWSYVPGTSSLRKLWFPTTIGTFTCTVGAATGVAGTPVLNTELFVDTIVAKSIVYIPKKPGYDATPGATFQSDITIHSPADDSCAFIILPVWGFQKMEFNFDQTTNSPTMNVLYALV